MEKVAAVVEMVATAVAEPFTFGADTPLFAVEGGQFAAGLAAFTEEFGAKMATKEVFKGGERIVAEGTLKAETDVELKNEWMVAEGEKASGANSVEYGEHIGKNGNKKILKPNVEYVDGNGYKYTTDDIGRINNTSGELNLGQGDRNSYAQRTVGGTDRLPTDDGGHIIASQFNGSGQIDNLIPQNSGINRAGGEWYNMEKSWSEALKSGSKVEVNIKPNYNLNSVRPDSFNVEYWIDGEKFIKFIRNP